ncbi:MAG: peptidase M14, partial [Acidobacteria bacterium]|nr:peptidase M14 [Acidobacteriota bacterium]
LYHKYTGHDNNRDWYAFTQVETQITVEKIHNTWRPQIVHDIHQQSATGARLFLPPYMQPVEPNVPRKIVEGYTELGLAMKDELRAAGFRGITWNSTYDAWTPARAYSHYHGGVRILSETASARIATPIKVKPEELRAGQSYDARKASQNFPDVWPGGEWNLRDITNYMTKAAFALLNHASKNRERWLRRFYEIGKEAVRLRQQGELYAYLIEPSYKGNLLVDILERGGVEVTYTKRIVINGKTYPNQTAVIRMAQPYGNFAKSLLESQHYPDLRDSSGHPIPPYDVTAHTLPLLMGVEAIPIFTPFRVRPTPYNSAYDVIAAKFLVRTPPAIYRSHIPSMDEGWTRWVL